MKIYDGKGNSKLIHAPLKSSTAQYIKCCRVAGGPDVSTELKCHTGIEVHLDDVSCHFSHEEGVFQNE